MSDTYDELDQAQRVERMREEVKKLGGIFSTEIEMPADLEEAFLRHILEYEQARPISLIQILENAGMTMPVPDDLDETEMTAKLWEIIERLSSLGAYLSNTNHLSDRELYEYLYRDGLREEAILFPEDPSYVYMLDILGSGDEEDHQLYLRYYADDDYRAQWKSSWPNDSIPEHENPPFDRDAKLPKSPHSYRMAS